MKYTLTIFSIFIAMLGVAQEKWFTRSGNISFYSSTPVEDIEGISNDVGCVLDMATNRLQFSVGMKSFVFEKALMQEHFNENYVESHKFPKATFKGELVGVSGTDFAQNELSPKVKGKLTIHGVTKDIETTSEFKKEGDTWVAKAVFKVKPQDYDIEIPSVVTDKIAEFIEVRVDVTLKPLKK